MTNPTLERAARALHEQRSTWPWEQLSETERRHCAQMARVVLRAATPEEPDSRECPGFPEDSDAWLEGFNACRQAILNDGEGE